MSFNKRGKQLIERLMQIFISELNQAIWERKVKVRTLI